MFNTGINKLDSLVTGGFPEGSIILIRGPQGTGKDILASQFLYQGIPDCVNFYLYFKDTEKDIKNKFKNYGMNIDSAIKDHKLILIDSSNHEKSKDVIDCELTNLYSVALALREFFDKNKDKRIRGVINIISQAMSITNPLIVYKFMSEIIPSLKQYNGSILLIMEEAMHKPEEFAAVEQLVDGIIVLKNIETKTGIEQSLLIKKMPNQHDNKYHHYEIKEKGLILID